jgi:aminopeptidase N
LSKIFSVVTHFQVRKIFRPPGYVLEVDIFDATKKMSTYEVAFMVSDFTTLNTVVDKRTYNIWGRADSIQQAQYGLSVTPGVIKFMENFTNIAFEYQKLDQAAIPGFTTGPMENWGLVTYRLVLVILSYC